ncbi:MAG TPA: hypothetical protein VGM10_05470 [Actinocrinis sp.]
MDDRGGRDPGARADCESGACRVAECPDREVRHEHGLDQEEAERARRGRCDPEALRSGLIQVCGQRHGGEQRGPAEQRRPGSRCSAQHSRRAHTQPQQAAAGAEPRPEATACQQERPADRGGWIGVQARLVGGGQDRERGDRVADCCSREATEGCGRVGRVTGAFGCAGAGTDAGAAPNTVAEPCAGRGVGPAEQVEGGRRQEGEAERREAEGSVRRTQSYMVRGEPELAGEMQRTGHRAALSPAALRPTADGRAEGPDPEHERGADQPHPRGDAEPDQGADQQVGTVPGEIQRQRHDKAAQHGEKSAQRRDDAAQRRDGVRQASAAV